MTGNDIEPTTGNKRIFNKPDSFLIFGEKVLSFNKIAFTLDLINAGRYIAR